MIISNTAILNQNMKLYKQLLNKPFSPTCYCKAIALLQHKLHALLLLSCFCPEFIAHQQAKSKFLHVNLTYKETERQKQLSRARLELAALGCPPSSSSHM
ncbi:hypothetical protein ACN47E_001419 [Coniothyrium glycines]